MAGFGQVSRECAGQSKVGPIGGKFDCLPGGDSFVDAGNRLVDPAGAEQEPAQCVREVVLQYKGRGAGVAESRLSNHGSARGSRPGPWPRGRRVTRRVKGFQKTVGSGPWHARSAAQASR